MQEELANLTRFVERSTGRPDQDVAREDSRRLGARSLVDLRDDYIGDCAKGIRRWNRVLGEHGVDYVLRLPHVGFNRGVGAFRDHHLTPDGRVISEIEWERSVGDWLPSDDEQAHVISLMTPQHEAGKMSGWIAPPARGINTRPVDYEYVRL